MGRMGDNQVPSACTPEVARPEKTAPAPLPAEGQVRRRGRGRRAADHAPGRRTRWLWHRCRNPLAAPVGLTAPHEGVAADTCC